MRNKASIGLLSLPAKFLTTSKSKKDLSISKKITELSEQFSKPGVKASREAVHRLRVSTRRLRALFQVFSQNKELKVGKSLRKRVKFLTNRLGETRSLDVSLKLWKKRFGASGDLKFVEDALRRFARSSRSRLMECLEKISGKSLRKKIEKVLPLLTADLEAYQRAWLKACARARNQARRDYLRYRRVPDMEHLHQLRIRFKRWRYVLEWDPGTNPEARRIEILKSLQDDIGELHDIEVLNNMLMKRQIGAEAQKSRAENELRTLRDQLKSEVRTGQRTFVMRQRRALKEIFA